LLDKGVVGRSITAAGSAAVSVRISRRFVLVDVKFGDEVVRFQVPTRAKGKVLYVAEDRALAQGRIELDPDDLLWQRR
jgi:hypothetical protein